jgi:hypothetical protein
VTGAVGARVYLHSPTRRQYLASVMAPQVWALAGRDAGEEIHVRSGWLGGPHLDLRAGGAIDWETVAGVLSAGSRRFPGTTPTEEAYLRRAVELGRIEAVPPPYPPLRAHGDTELIAAAPRSGLREVGLSLMLPPLLTTAATEGQGAVLAAVAEALLTLADCHPYGLRFGIFSLRSHAEAFFHWAGPAADYRASFTARLEKDGPVLRQLVRQVQAGEDHAAAAQWRQAFKRGLASFAGQSEDWGDPSSAVAALGGGVAGSSAFHRAVAASGVIAETPEWFPAYRLVINLFYELLPALDIRPVQRFYLCHALAESVDAVVGETWQERLAALETLSMAAR